MKYFAPNQKDQLRNSKKEQTKISLNRKKISKEPEKKSYILRQMNKSTDVDFVLKITWIN